MQTSTVSLSELHRACFKGKLAKCKEIVESDATTLLGIDSAGNSPLHMAAAFGHDDVCSFLLGHGADVDAQSTVSLPLVGPSKRHDDANAANTRSDCQDGGTALHLAVIKGHASTVKLLVGAGADLSIKSKISKSAYDCTLNKMPLLFGVPSCLRCA